MATLVPYELVRTCVAERSPITAAGRGLDRPLGCEDLRPVDVFSGPIIVTSTPAWRKRFQRSE